MNEPAKHALRVVIVIVVLVFIIVGVRAVERKRQNKYKTAKANAFAGGSMVTIDGAGEWHVITYNAKNGKCYDIHTRDKWAFAIPCE
jgi:hypothetical protein